MSDHLLLRMHANRLAVRALVLGEPAEARRHQQQAPRGDFGPAFRFLSRWGDFVTGLSYLWEGQVRLVEETLGPVVADAEASLGRRSPLTCMLATVLATALWERDRPQEAAALLANRLDVLERAGIPETLLLAYRTQARIAAAEGGEHRALDLLESLHAAGVARRLPRLCVASLADQVRVHARRYRPETCRALCKQIDELLARDDLPQGALWRRSVEVWRALAVANAAVAAQDWPRALEALQHAGTLADALKLGRVRIEIMALRAFALDRNADDGLPLLREAMNLAETYGLARLFVDAHPALGDWAQRAAAEAGGPRSEPAAPCRRRADRSGQAGARQPRLAPCRAWCSRRRSARFSSCSRGISRTRKSRSPWKSAKRPSSGISRTCSASCPPAPASTWCAGRSSWVSSKRPAERAATGVRCWPGEPPLHWGGAPGGSR